MQKVVLKLDIHDDVNCKRKVMKSASSIAGLESISMDMKDKKLTVTVIGDMDPVSLVEKLRKNYRTEIISVGPAKEPEKPKEESKKPQSKAQVNDFVHAMQAYNSSNNSYYIDPSYPRYGGYYRSVEEDPNGCIIC